MIKTPDSSIPLVNRILCLFVFCLNIFTNLSCIHVSSTEHKTLDLKSKKTLQEITGPANLRISSLIYTESIYPLETFLKKLIEGDFNDAISTVTLSYKPSNVDNQLISELIEEGLVPVYVKIENRSTVPMTISERNFYITDNERQFSALSSQEIPRAFKRFSSSAVAANAYNIGATAVVYVGVLVAVGIVSSQGGQFQNSGHLGSTTNHSSTAGSDEIKILNKTQKTTVIDFQDYLLGEKTLAPFTAIEGLLFFRIQSKNSDLALAFK